MELSKEQQLLKEVIYKAWEDSAFKEELIKDPIASIEKLTGKKLKLPEGKKFIVRDQTDASAVYINIPAEKKMDDVELNEDQLELVAGGTTMAPDVFFPDPFDDIIIIDKPNPPYNPFPDNSTVQF